MAELILPKKFDFGFGELVEIKYIENIFGVSRRTAMKYLRALRIKPFYIGDEVYFSLMTLKRILFVLSRPGAKGFIFPGSKAKYNPRFKKDDECMTVISDDILEEASDPKTLAEMSASSGRDSSIIKKLISPKQGRPKKDKNE
jgi:hypothetical protein